jgi:hypothetical protein
MMIPQRRLLACVGLKRSIAANGGKLGAALRPQRPQHRSQCRPRGVLPRMRNAGGIPGHDLGFRSAGTLRHFGCDCRQQAAERFASASLRHKAA